MKTLLKRRLGENSFLLLFSLAPQVMCPLDEAVVVQEVGVGTWRFLSAHLFCSHVGPLHGPLKAVPVPVWAPPQAAIPSGVSLLQCGVSFQECISSCICNSCPFSMLPCAFLSTLSQISSCAFFCICYCWQLLPFSDKLGELEDGRQQVYGASWNWLWPTQGCLWLPPMQPLLPKPALYPQYTPVPVG